MSERRFDIHEIRGAVARGWCHPKTKHLEMDVELAEAISYEVLQLLLHGEGKEEPVPRPDEWPTVNRAISRKEAIDISRRTLEQAERERLPSPTPTRAEWEAWLERMPSFYKELSVVREWFLSMPCVPKEGRKED